MLTSTILIGSQTNTIRAQKCLNSASIRSEIIKSNTDRSKGCVFAIKIPTDQVRKALQALDNCKISYKY